MLITSFPTWPCSSELGIERRFRNVKVAGSIPSRGQLELHQSSLPLWSFENLLRSAHVWMRGVSVLYHMPW